jgi:hypothetical protein
MVSANVGNTHKTPIGERWVNTFAFSHQKTVPIKVILILGSKDEINPGIETPDCDRKFCGFKDPSGLSTCMQIISFS